MQIVFSETEDREPDMLQTTADNIEGFIAGKRQNVVSNAWPASLLATHP